jgi:hypothetical protein
VGVAPDAVPLAPRDEQQLGVGLHRPVDHAHAVLREARGGVEVLVLGPAGAELDHDRHLLAEERGLDERVDDRRVGAGPVDRLPDGGHVGVGRGLPDEVRDRLRGLEGVVEELVAGVDRGEDVRAASQAGRRRGQVRRELEVRPLAALVDGLEAPEVDGPVQPVQVVGLEPDLLEEELGDVGGAVAHELEPDRVAGVAVQELLLDRGPELLGPDLVELQVAVAGDAERVAAGDLHAAEELGLAEGGDERGEEHEVVRRPGHGPRDLHDARRRARHLHGGDRLLVVVAVRVLPAERDEEREPAVVDAREGVGRVEPHRREERGDVGREGPLRPLPLGRRPHRVAPQADVVGLELGHEREGDELVLRLDELVGPGRELRQGPRRRDPVGAVGRHAARRALAQAGHPDLEELVEVRRQHDVQPQPLEERPARVAGQLQEPRVVLEEAEVPVEVQPRVPEAGHERPPGEEPRGRRDGSQALASAASSRRPHAPEPLRGGVVPAAQRPSHGVEVLADGLARAAERPADRVEGPPGAARGRRPEPAGAVGPVDAAREGEGADAREGGDPHDPHPVGALLGELLLRRKDAGGRVGPVHGVDVGDRPGHGSSLGADPTQRPCPAEVVAPRRSAGPDRPRRDRSVEG